MKCLSCGTDSKYKDRKDQRCPKCQAEFAFEPAGNVKDPVTDQLFHNAIVAVSSGGKIQWGIEHLYYEINRRKKIPPGCAIALIPTTIFVLIASLGAGAKGGAAVPLEVRLILPALLVSLGVFLFYRHRNHPYPRITQEVFDKLWARWLHVRGKPKGVITRLLPAPANSVRGMAQKVFGRREPAVPMLTSDEPPPRQFVRSTSGAPLLFGKRNNPPAVPERLRTLDEYLKALESQYFVAPEIRNYSFDRAVICDRARTVDLLVANNFHFENNCAVLSVDGYPEGPFSTVKAMLKRNPKLQVFALHDATPDGCRLAHHVAYSPEWFGGLTRVIDLGLRPRHVKPFRGLWIPATDGIQQSEPGIDSSEAAWLSNHALELAAIRPEYVLKRLFAGLSAHAKDEPSSDGGVSYCGSFDGGGSDGGGSDGGGHDGAADSGGDSFG